MNRKLPPCLYERRHTTKPGYRQVYYYVRFVDWKGVRRKWPAGSDFARARDFVTLLRSQNVQKYDFDSDKIKGVTFSIWKIRYLKIAENKRSLDRDVQHIEHLEEFFGEMLLKDIFGTKIAEYKNLRLASPIMRYKKPVENTLVKISTVNRELRLLHRMLHLAAADGIIETVPVISFGSEKHLARQRTLSSAEISVLCNNSPPWLRRVFELALETSWARSDLLGLTWKDVEWDDVDRRGINLIGRKKTGIKAFVPILPQSPLEAVLADIWQERAKVRPIAGDWVLTKDGRQITKDQLRKAFEVATAAAGVVDFVFHDFRHTAITMWATLGIPVETAMAMAGHASTQMHDRYVNLKEADIRKAVEVAMDRHKVTVGVV